MSNIKVTVHDPSRLFDMRKNDWPRDEFAIWRTVQVYRCGICGALTNECFGRGCLLSTSLVHTICPNAMECWHHELEIKLEWLNHPHPRAYRETLEEEIRELRAGVKRSVRNNVVGDADTSLVVNDVHWTGSCKPGQHCKHDRGSANFYFTAKGWQLKEGSKKK